MRHHVTVAVFAIAAYLAFKYHSSVAASSLVTLVFFALYVFPVLWRESIANPLRDIPIVQSDWKARCYQWAYTEPSPHQLRDWVKKSVSSNGLFRYHAIGGKTRVLLTNADTVKEVFVHQQYDFFEKPELIRLRTGNNIGFGLSATSGKVHRLQRRIMMPALNLQHARALTPLFWEKTVELISVLRGYIDDGPGGLDDSTMIAPSRLVDVPRWASRVTIDSIGPGVLGKDFNSIQDPQTPFYNDYKALAELSMSATNIVKLALVIPMTILARLPLEVNRLQRGAVIASRKVCIEATKEHRKADSLEGKKDVLSLAMKSGMFDDEELINHMGNLLGAGHETTAFQIAYTCFFLCKNQQMQDRVRSEVRSNLPSPSSGEPIDAKLLESMPFLQAVVNESLRLLPAATGIYRTALRDTTLAGQHLPAGTMVAAFPLVNHYLESNWGPDAAAFNPDRWLAPGQEQLGGAKSQYDIIGFSLGPRNCPGAAFARQELLAVVAGLVGSFKMELEDPTYEPVFRYNVSLAPAGGLDIKFTSMQAW